MRKGNRELQVDTKTGKVGNSINNKYVLGYWQTAIRFNGYRVAFGMLANNFKWSAIAMAHVIRVTVSSSLIIATFPAFPFLYGGMDYLRARRKCIKADRKFSEFKARVITVKGLLEKHKARARASGGGAGHGSGRARVKKKVL